MINLSDYPHVDELMKHLSLTEFAGQGGEREGGGRTPAFVK